VHVAEDVIERIQPMPVKPFTNSEIDRAAQTNSSKAASHGPLLAFEETR